MTVPSEPPLATGTPSAGTSPTLLERLRGNDPAAWERVVRLYGPLVLFWARRAGLNEADAADVLRDVFRPVSAAIGRFRRDRETDTFCGWLWVIARNKLRDHFRAAAGQPAAAGGTGARDRLAQMPGDEPDSAAAPSRAGRCSTGRWTACGRGSRSGRGRHSGGPQWTASRPPTWPPNSGSGWPRCTRPSPGCSAASARNSAG